MFSFWVICPGIHCSCNSACKDFAGVWKEVIFRMPKYSRGHLLHSVEKECLVRTLWSSVFPHPDVFALLFSFPRYAKGLLCTSFRSLLKYYNLSVVFPVYAIFKIKTFLLIMAFFASSLVNFSPNHLHHLPQYMNYLLIFIYLSLDKRL
jgi:hypothetical protein